MVKSLHTEPIVVYPSVADPHQSYNLQASSESGSASKSKFRSYGGSKRSRKGSKWNRGVSKWIRGDLNSSRGRSKWSRGCSQWRRGGTQWRHGGSVGQLFQTTNTLDLHKSKKPVSNTDPHQNAMPDPDP